MTPSNDTVFVIRTNVMDDRLREMIAEIRQAVDFHICLVADERIAPVAAPDGVAKVSLSFSAVDEMGLLAPHDCIWRCGDYGLYLVRAMFPNAKRFWVSEPDVYINSESLAGFFAQFQDIDDDFLASRFGPTSPGWVWYHAMRPYTDKVFQCVFSFVRFSGRALDHLQVRRRALSEAFKAIDPGTKPLWANDEVFCATELANGGFVCRDLNAAANAIYTRATLRVTPPMSLQRLQGSNKDGMVYHPVLAGADFESKMQRRLASELVKRPSQEQLRRTFDARALDDLEIECGAQSRERFELEMQEAMEAAA